MINLATIGHASSSHHVLLMSRGSSNRERWFRLYFEIKAVEAIIRNGARQNRDLNDLESENFPACLEVSTLPPPQINQETRNTPKKRQQPIWGGVPAEATSEHVSGKGWQLAESVYRQRNDGRRRRWVKLPLSCDLPLACREAFPGLSPRRRWSQTWQSQSPGVDRQRGKRSTRKTA